MSLARQLEQQLTASTAGPCRLAAREGDVEAVCDLASIDSLGVCARRMEVRSPRLHGHSADELKQVAQELATRVSYLLEAIAPIEIDHESCRVQMRSKPPYRKENATCYYEVLVTHTAISLQRYRKQRSETRQAEPFAITREVLYRLVDDFSAAIASLP